MHDHDRLYAAPTDTGIDRDCAGAPIRRSGRRANARLMRRARIAQRIESGVLVKGMFAAAMVDQVKP